VAKLVIRSGRNAGEEYVVGGDRVILGRRSACPIPILDVGASREHAAVSRRGNDVFIQDLSRNGTFINGQPATKSHEGSLVKFGDRIKIGDTELELVDETKEDLTVDIPGYKILERIGSGGMGAVYKARQLSMDRIVALKVLNERYSSNPEFRERFVREAQAAGQLNHPNVIHVHDISSANGRHYFSMEYVDGPSVKELLHTEKRIEVNRALDITLQAAKALEFAHENKIVHRDVKPDNIMLTKEGIVKLADLGIAKTFEEKQATERERRRVMGTPHYMAPEQALGKAIDLRVDIYSLGATLYHMLTGKTPFAGNSAHEILKAHIQESLPPIQDLNPMVPDPVCFIVERMMAKLPEKRYPDMTHLITDIQRVQAGVVAGIARIEPGESTVMRAVKGKEGAKPKEEEQARKAEGEGEPKSDTAELPTEMHPRIPALLQAAALVLVFIGVVAAVVHFVPRWTQPPSGPGTGTVVQPDGGEHGTTPGSGRSSPEAKKLLLAAYEAQKNNDPSEYERNLKSAVERYPTSAEATEAKRLLEERARLEREALRKNAESAFSEAKSFEAANPADLGEAIRKYTRAMEAAKDCPDILEAAKASVEALQKKQREGQNKAVETAFRTATDVANTAKARCDYDAARSALQEFINANGGAPQKADADTALAKINTEAAAKLQEVKDAVANLDVVAALAEWSKYTGQVKDAAAGKDAESAIQALETKAEQLVQEEVAKAADKAKKYNYSEALASVRNLLRRLSGIKKCEEPLKAKEEALRRQKDLHDKFLAASADKLKGGAIPLPFIIDDPRFRDVKWKISGIKTDQVMLDAMTGQTLGTSKRIGDLKPNEQYKLYMLFLPKELSPDDHKALAAFCQERGLAAEAEIHSQKAGVEKKGD